MTDYHQDRPPIHTAGDYQQRPAIHVCLAREVEAHHYWWVAVGAEEEGVPCQRVLADETDVAALAYHAARSSRLGVGVGITPNQIAIHEVHMPAHHPVLLLDIRGQHAQICRLAGSNAARLVVGVPLRFGAD